MPEVPPQGIEFAESAPVVAEGSAVAPGSPEEVWSVLVDTPRWSAWFPGVSSSRATSDPSTGIGATREVVLRGGGRVQERFIAWDEGRLWAFTAVEITPRTFRRLVERATLTEEGPGRTRVDYRMAFEPAPGLRPAVPVLRRLIGRSLTKGMRGLADEVAARRS